MKLTSIGKLKVMERYKARKVKGSSEKPFMSHLHHVHESFQWDDEIPASALNTGQVDHLAN